MADRKRLDSSATEDDDSCECRLEVGTQGASSGSVVNILVAFSATANTVASARPVKAYQLADTAAIGFDDGSRPKCILRLSPRIARLAAPGDESNTITFDNPFFSSTLNYGAPYEALDPGPEITLPATAADITGGGGGNPLPPGAAVACEIHNLPRSAWYAIKAMPENYTWYRKQTNSNGVLEFAYPSTLLRLKVRYDP